MTTLIDFIMDLFRSPDRAAEFIANPDLSMRDAGVPANVTAAQLQAVAATAGPAGLALGGGDPVAGLQRAVADHHNFASPFSPTFAPQTQTDFASHNATEVASNNDFMSPDQSAGANAQNGAFNLGFGDITFGDKTSNTATEGGVVNTGAAGHIDTTSVKGNGNVVGDANSANTGTVVTGAHGSTNIGHGNDTYIKDGSQHAGGDVISGNDGPVIKDVDTSGGHGGNASSSGGGGLINVGGGGHEANAGSGGAGGSIILTDSHRATTAGTADGGSQPAIGHEVSSSSSAAAYGGFESDHAVHQEYSVDHGGSIHNDGSTFQESSLHHAAGANLGSESHVHS